MSSFFQAKFAERQAEISLLFAAVLWGLLWWPLGYFRSQEVNGLWSAILTYSFALLPGFWLIRKQYGLFAQYPLSLLLIAITSGWCNVSFIVALAAEPRNAARIVLLFYLAPVWSIILGIIFLNEKPSKIALGAALLAVLGAIMMLYNPLKGTMWPKDVYDWLAISSGLTFAITNLFIRGSQAPLGIKTFVTWLGVLGVASVWLLFSGWYTGAAISLPSISSGLWLGIAALGLLGVTTMTLAVQFGVSRLPLFKSSIILVFEVLVTIVSSMLIDGEVLLHLAPYGAACIIFAAVLAGWDGNAKKN